MPVIVDEIVISVEVGGEATAPVAPAAGATPPQERRALIAECVERVLDVLQRKEER